MQSLAVVKDLDVFEGSRLDLGMSRVANAMHALVLEAVEPTFCRRVDAPMSSNVFSVFAIAAKR